MKDDMKDMGIRSDRIMTEAEVQNVAANYNSVKRARETPIGPVGWLILGFGWFIVLLGALSTLFG